MSAGKVSIDIEFFKIFTFKIFIKYGIPDFSFKTHIGK